MSNGILYLVATPIGNLGDITARAAATLGSVDFIAAEDTRVSQKLLSHLGLHKPLVSYYEHNKRERGIELVERMKNGENCALVTDAGTPAISDPGEDLVALCAQNGIECIPIPGACAAVCALAASGLPSVRWCFEGFLSVNKKERRAQLDMLKNETRTMIFYEAPHKLKVTLADLCENFGQDRRISLSREITKLHEETLRMTIGEAVTYFGENNPRGEFVLVIEGAQNIAQEIDEDALMQLALTDVKSLIENGERLADAVKTVSVAMKIKKNALYKLALEENKSISKD